ncbi:MAG: SRPBCC domain-containing protein [Betaproteobacteria bacterium]|nr:SRPBCC domain-containing protein [Betaproteobacteria bacterium]
MPDDNATPDAVFRIVIQADINRVWRELTKTDEAQGAVFNAWLHTTGLVPGGRLQMRTGTGKHVLVVGEVLEFDPPHRFVHSHRFTQYDDPVCQVAYELKPVAGGVEVTLRVIGMPAGTPTAKAMQQGGDAILKSLKAIAETGAPPLGTRLMYAAFALLEFVLPKRTRSEHWPL